MCGEGGGVVLNEGTRWSARHITHIPYDSYNGKDFSPNINH